MARERRERALILAAGIGRRLGGEAAGAAGAMPAAQTERPPEALLPKALLRIGGASLLARHIAILRQCGVTDISIVVGYREEAIQAELATLGGGVALLRNPDFRTGSVVSLLAGRAVLESGAPVVLMDADVFYDARLMARLLDSPIPDCLLLDRAIEPGDEPVKICVEDGRIVDFRKRPENPGTWHGESVGFFRLAPVTAARLAARAAAYVATGRAALEYEEPIRDMILAGEGAGEGTGEGGFGFEDISGLPWTEIDFPEDVAKAQALAATMEAVAA